MTDTEIVDLAVKRAESQISAELRAELPTRLYALASVLRHPNEDVDFDRAAWLIEEAAKEIRRLTNTPVGPVVIYRDDIRPAAGDD
jgi:hypothetical protein